MDYVMKQQKDELAGCFIFRADHILVREGEGLIFPQVRSPEDLGIDSLCRYELPANGVGRWAAAAVAESVNPPDGYSFVRLRTLFGNAPDELFCLYPEDGLITHSNHFLHPAAQAKLRDTNVATSPDSLFRHRRVRALLAEKLGALTLDDLREALFDDYGTPYSVCRPPRAIPGGPVTATSAMTFRLARMSA